VDAVPAQADAVQLDLGLAVIGLAYERRFLSRMAVQLEVHAFGTWFGPALDEPSLQGFGAGVRPSFFLTEDGGRGVYVAPFLRIDDVKSNTTGSARSWGYSTGAFVGYSWIFAERWNLRIGAGGQWLAYETFVGQTRESFKTLFPALDLVVGYSF
jgi:hypothetical protein